MRIQPALDLLSFVVPEDADHATGERYDLDIIL
jgi:hypothetical protein